MQDCLSDYLCGATLVSCIEDSCDNPMFSGMNARAFIINKNDIEDYATSAGNKNLITDIYFKSSISNPVYVVVNARNNPYTGTNTSVEIGDYRNTFTRTVSLYVPMDGADVIRDIINPLASGKFVVVLQNDYVNSNQDNEFPIIGIDKGLVVSSLVQTKYENNDYWIVELQETGVPSANKFFRYAGDIDDVTAQFASMTWTRSGNTETLFTSDTGGYSFNLENVDRSGVLPTVEVEMEVSGVVKPVVITLPINIDVEITIRGSRYVIVNIAEGDSAAFLCKHSNCAVEMGGAVLPML